MIEDAKGKKVAMKGNEATVMWVLYPSSMEIDGLDTITPDEPGDA